MVTPGKIETLLLQTTSSKWHMVYGIALFLRPEWPLTSYIYCLTFQMRFLYICTAVDKISSDRASQSPSAIAEFLVVFLVFLSGIPPGWAGSAKRTVWDNWRRILWVGCSFLSHKYHCWDIGRKMKLMKSFDEILGVFLLSVFSIHVTLSTGDVYLSR